MTETPGCFRAQLVSYIAPSAPATRRPGTGKEPFIRPEIGFTPLWYRDALGIDFGQPWHTDPAYRRGTLIAMGRELKKRFGNAPIGWVNNADAPEDLLTGVFGGSVVAAIYGVPIHYSCGNWPASAQKYLSDGETDRLEPPDLNRNAFFAELMEQVEWIARQQGKVFGFVNWQGVLNNAYRLRGEAIFSDIAAEPARARRLFECIAHTMIDGARRLHARQKASGVELRDFTVSNCMVNMVSPRTYRDLLLSFDREIAEAFRTIGIHDCAWTADPYLEHYATIPNISYVDMGLDSDLVRARNLFPHARRALMYTPMDVARKNLEQIGRDFERIARDYAPCDIVLADIESGVPDERIIEILNMCGQLGQTDRIVSH